MSLNQFKNFNVDALTLDELVGLAAYGRSLRAEYEAHNLDEPEFVDLNLKALRREIVARQADTLEMRKRQISQKLDSLKTPAQKKQELQKELRNIEAQLAEVG